MSTLTMALAAALITGSAPGEVSGESRPALELSGEWEGFFYFHGSRVEARLSRGILSLDWPTGEEEIPIRYFDDGKGSLRLPSRGRLRGPNRRGEDSVVITFTSEEGAPRGRVLTLRRVGSGR